MKILIVEDEFFVRLGIKKLIEDLHGDYEVVGDAEDGIVALNMVEQLRPDVVLIDIVMPRMDGMECLRNIRANYPYCKCVLISSHDDFNYLREAIRLGASDYIMKATVDAATLAKVLDNISNEIRQQHALRRQIHESYVWSNKNREEILKSVLGKILENGVASEADCAQQLEALGISFDKGPMFLLVFAIMDGFGEQYAEKEQDTLLYGIRNIISELLQQNTDCLIYQRQAREIIAIAWESPLFCEATIEDVCISVISTLKEIMSVCVLVGCSDRIDSIVELKSAYQKACAIYSRHFFDKCANLAIWNQLPECDSVADNTWHDMVQQVLMQLSQVNLGAALCIAETYQKEDAFSSLKDEQSFRKDLFMCCIVLLSVQKTELLQQLIATLETKQSAHSAKELFGQFVNCLYAVQHQRQFAEGDTAGLMNLAKMYIQRNIEQKSLSLVTVANSVNLSPSYFSRLFKQENQISFADYLLQERMSAAKNLIDSGETITQIALRLGYTEVSSFSRAFKRVVGLSPQKYKHRMEAKTEAES